MSTAIVTGASTGIGRAVAERLAREGMAVVANSIHDAEGGRSVVEAISEAGGNASYVQADVATPEGAARVFDHAVERHGDQISFLVNNAGATRTCEFRRWTVEHWHDMLDTNLVTVALMCQEFERRRPHAASGAIVNVGSIRGLERFGRIGAGAYSAAKAGVINLTASLALALAPHVTVNSVSPGFVSTSYMERADSELKKSWLDGMPIQRFIEPAEIAEAILSLLRQPAITGANLVVDGAWTVTAR